MGYSLLVVDLETGISHSLLVFPSVITRQVLPFMLDVMILLLLAKFTMQIIQMRRQPATHNLEQPYNSECPICMTEWNHGVRTNCNHAFCGSCLYHSLLGRRLRCPICRARVTRIQPLDSEDAVAEASVRSIASSPHPRGDRPGWHRQLEPLLATAALLLVAAQCLVAGLVTSLPILALLILRSMLVRRA